MSRATLHVGNVLDVLPTLAAGSVRCCVTSPPYWGLRDYGAEGQLGMEPTPDAYVANMVCVFRGVRRVLADDGTLWLNLGDSYAANRGGSGMPASHGLKHKDLVGIPWRVAFALQADGWYLRSDIIWAKPNPMPESVTDRPTKAHEYLFLLAKSERYYYDAAAIAEPASQNVPWAASSNGGAKAALVRGDGNSAGLGVPAIWKSQRAPAGVYTGDAFAHPQSAPRGPRSDFGEFPTRNTRTVWTIPTQPYAEAHFATFPEELPRRCIMAGSAPGDTVLDPFAGSGTTLAVAIGNGRHGLGIELNPEYADMARRRIGPMFCEVAA